MRGDRLVSLVLLLRQHGRMTAPALARELEVSTRTVLRDVEALAVAGVPIEAERGRNGGFSLLPGLRTELTGLGRDEALALLVAGSRPGAQAFGLGSALASAMLKVVDALPENHRHAAAGAAERLLVEPEIDLLARRVSADEPAGPAMTQVRRAVLAGRKLRIHYAVAGSEPEWRTVDPIGLVTVRGQGYLLAARDGADRTYRLSRISAAEELDEPADRPDRVDLGHAWQERSERFRAGDGGVAVVVRVAAAAREALADTALAVVSEAAEGDGAAGAKSAAGEQLAPGKEPVVDEEPAADDGAATREEVASGGGWRRLELTFQDARHAEWAVWQLGTQAEAVEPAWLRESLRKRAVEIAARYRD